RVCDRARSTCAIFQWSGGTHRNTHAKMQQLQYHDPRGERSHRRSSTIAIALYHKAVGLGVWGTRFEYYAAQQFSVKSVSKHLCDAEKGESVVRSTLNRDLCFKAGAHARLAP